MLEWEFARALALSPSRGLSKTFVVREKVRLRFESTFTNIFNHPNFAPPVSMDVSSLSQFGGNTAHQQLRCGTKRTVVGERR